MLSVVIPTLNSADTLTATLAALVPGSLSGLVREVVISDGGSDDATAAIADDAGAVWVPSSGANRGAQLRSGAEAARAPWLLFLHADTVLEPGWHHVVHAHISLNNVQNEPLPAATFQFRLDDQGVAPRTVEAAVWLRTKAFKLPYGDQGLLISRTLYDEIGGYRPVHLMEDVDLVRRIGRRRLTALPSNARTSAKRYREAGYVKRVLRNQLCLALYFLNVSPERLSHLYGSQPSRPTAQISRP